MPEMTPAELAAKSGPAALLEAFVALGGEASPSGLRMRSGLASSTTSKWLGSLRDAGLVAGSQQRPHLTAEGWALAERSAPATTGGSLELAEAIARWPAEPQRAYLRLLIAAVISRQHLAGPRASHHPGFIAAGRTGTGKTSIARFVCQAFGVDAATQIIELGSRTAGEILGRREIDPQEGEWRFDASPLMGRPLVVFDEFDKADQDQRRAALLCFQGDTRRVIEETPVELRAVPMLACNTPQENIPVPLEYRRRSIVLGMDAFADLLEDLDLALYELEAAGGPPRLQLDALRPPASRLSDETLRTLRDLLRRGLTEDGWRLCNLPAVELLALGYAAGDDTGLAAAVIATARDYLTCAETVGETRPTWRRDLTGLRTGESAAAALQAGQAERDRLDAARRAREITRAQESLELIGARNTLAEELRQARPDARALRPEHRPAAKGLRAQLEHLRERVLASRSEQSLDELRVPAEALLASVRELVDRDARQRDTAAAAADAQRRQQQTAREHERRRQVEERQRRDAERQAIAEAARHSRAERTARRRQAAGQLTAVRAEARPLEALWKRTSGDPLAALRDVRALGRPLLTFQRDSAQQLGTGLGARLLGAVAGMAGEGTWRATFNPALRLPGTVTSCDALTWGPPVRAVIAEPLRRLHELEDRHQVDAGRPARRSRPRVRA